MTERRFSEIETRLAFQDESLRVLNEVVCRQQQQIEHLEQMCRMLRERCDELVYRRTVPSGGEDAQDERPPHY